MNSFLYQQNNGYFAQVAENVEAAAAKELAGLGAQRPNPVHRGIYFNAESEALYRIVYQTRLCTRVLAPLLHFNCHSTKYLYKTALTIPWDQLLTVDQSFMINARVSESRISHSRYAALRLKDVIADWFQQRVGVRPNVDKTCPDLVFDLHIRRNQAVISLDLAGASLHRRAYRRKSVEAPIQETLAAAIIEFSGWDGKKSLVDPFCGSGTLLAEALMRRTGLPAAYLRAKFGFEHLPDFNPTTWAKVKAEAAATLQLLPPGLLAGSDLDPLAIQATRSNLALLPGGDQVTLRVSSFQELEPIPNAVIVSNPPYGVRLGDQRSAAARIREFGSFLKHKCTGSTACLYFGERQMLKEIGLKPNEKIHLSNGGLEGVLARYEIY